MAWGRVTSPDEKGYVTNYKAYCGPCTRVYYGLILGVPGWTFGQIFHDAGFLAAEVGNASEAR